MTRLVSDAARLPRAEFALAQQAGVWLILARVNLRLVSYGTVRRMLARVPVPRRGTRSVTPVDCARAISRAARLLPDSTCLARAIAAAALLRRHGYASTLGLQVARTSAGELDAHATLEVEGTVIVGGDAPRGQSLMRDHVALS